MPALHSFLNGQDSVTQESGEFYTRLEVGALFSYVIYRRKPSDVPYLGTMSLKPKLIDIVAQIFGALSLQKKVFNFHYF